MQCCAKQSSWGENGSDASERSFSSFMQLMKLYTATLIRLPLSARRQSLQFDELCFFERVFLLTTLTEKYKIILIFPLQ